MPLRTKALMQLDRRGVAPVQVVEDEDERLAFGDQRQEPAHGAMAAMALVTEPRSGRLVPGSK